MLWLNAWVKCVWERGVLGERCRGVPRWFKYSYLNKPGCVQQPSINPPFIAKTKINRLFFMFNGCWFLWMSSGFWSFYLLGVQRCLGAFHSTVSAQWCAFAVTCSYPKLSKTDVWKISVMLTLQSLQSPPQSFILIYKLIWHWHWSCF